MTANSSARAAVASLVDRVDPRAPGGALRVRSAHRLSAIKACASWTSTRRIPSTTRSRARDLSRKGTIRVPQENWARWSVPSPLPSPRWRRTAPPVDPSDIDAVTRMSNAVADTVVENVQSFEIWDDGDTPRLLLVARQKGLSMNCEGFEVDEERFRTTMAAI